MRKKKRQSRLSTSQPVRIINRYENILQQVSKQVGRIISVTYDGTPESVLRIRQILNDYSEQLNDWSEEKASSILEELNRADLAMWRRSSESISRSLYNIIQNTPIGQTARAMVYEQIKYIKSIPIYAAIRVEDIHNKAFETVASGGRSKEIYDEIMRSGEVASSRARLIARTEIGRASTALSQSRAMSIGSDGYIWRTSEDGDVRHSHDLMEGKFVRWDSPPTLDGLTGHAGALPNCRCYPEIVIPDYYEK